MAIITIVSVLVAVAIFAAGTARQHDLLVQAEATGEFTS
jgi:hypothetical protein